MPSQPSSVSVIFPIGPAIDRVKRVLFQPFDLGKWFVIGFCAWLASLGEPGFNGGFNFMTPGQRRGAGDWANEAWDWFVRNLYWIAPLLIGIVIIAIAFWVVFTWLSSRGRFMFLHCVARDRAEVAAPWSEFAREANSLFVFRLVLGLLGSVVMLPLLALGGFLIYSMVERGGPTAAAIAGLTSIAFIVIVLAIAFAIVSKFTTDFVVPIMFLRRQLWRTAWRELLMLLSPNVGHFILYVLFQILIAIATGMIVLAVVIVTCCIAGCIMAIPFLGTVLLLPLIMFQRCYSLYYLTQFGREYDVFTPPDQTAPGMPSVSG